MTKKTKILGILILMGIGVLAFLWGRHSTQPEVVVKTSQQIYSRGEEVEITIWNNTFKQVCFSSCYPYYLQRKEGDWKSYSYSECFEEDLNIPCISSGMTKKFSFTLNERLQPGLHRILVSLNKGGEKGEKFEETGKTHSDPFDVK